MKWVFDLDGYHELDQRWIITSLINSLSLVSLKNNKLYTQGVTKKRCNLTCISIQEVVLQIREKYKGARNRHTKEGKTNLHFI